MSLIRKSNYARHGHFVGEIKKSVQGFLFHQRFLPKFRHWHASRVNVFYFVVHPDFTHPGLADRLKAIIYCYYIAKQSGYDFKIVYTHPFQLTDYICENRIKWAASENDLEYAIADTRFFIYTARRTGTDYKLPPNRQYHCYCYKGDDLFYQTGHHYGMYFGELYNELFKPSCLLQNAIDSTNIPPKTYVSVHIRFVNALGMTERAKYPTLSAQRQETLIEQCHSALVKIADQNELPVYVFSDSERFLDTLTNLPVHIIDRKRIGHVSHTTDKEAILKTFLDWYLIANSSKVYRLLSDDLYQTNFSLYAALIKETQVIDYHIQEK
jgi:hypothetical protein